MTFNLFPLLHLTKPMEKACYMISSWYVWLLFCWPFPLEAFECVCACSQRACRNGETLLLSMHWKWLNFDPQFADNLRERKGNDVLACFICTTGNVHGLPFFLLWESHIGMFFSLPLCSRASWDLLSGLCSAVCELVLVYCPDWCFHLAHQANQLEAAVLLAELWSGVKSFSSLLSPPPNIVFSSEKIHFIMHVSWCKGSERAVMTLGTVCFCEMLYYLHFTDGTLFLPLDWYQTFMGLK